MVATAQLALLLAVIQIEPRSQLFFNEHFQDVTMRIDFVHEGNARDETISLKQIHRGRAWAGSRVHLLDTFGVGGYIGEVYSLDSGALLFRKTFNSYFGGYRGTPQAAHGAKISFTESLLIRMARG